jgi:hypothetical protein
VGGGVLLGSLVGSVGVGDAIGGGESVIDGVSVFVGEGVTVGVYVGVNVALGGRVGVRLAAGLAVGTGDDTWLLSVETLAGGIVAANGAGDGWQAAISKADKTNFQAGIERLGVESQA